jgi:uncharacterized protein (TIGR02453 family)
VHGAYSAEVPTTRRSRSPRTSADPPAYKGWPVEAVEFLRGIEAENNKEFWTANKLVYQTKVLAPMTALLAELAPDYGEGRVFRPYRDTRFSADKSPYKTNIAAHNDAVYISLSPDALGVGAGLYMPSPDQLVRFRAAVADERSGTELLRVLAGLKKKHVEVGSHETLKTAPRGYASDHPRIEVLRYKGLTAWKEWPVGPWLGTSTPKRRIIEFIDAVGPLKKWLDLNVGAPEPAPQEPARRRQT